MSARIPAPGEPVRGSGSGRPIMALLDLLGRRWSLRILWELRDGSVPFRALQGRCGGMSSSVLSQRLAELAEAGILERGADGYGLTVEGERLLGGLAPLQSWAERWASRAEG